MDQAIFNLNMSVEATSLYLMLDDMLSRGETPRFDACEAKWTASCEKLEDAMRELGARGVIDLREDGAIEVKESQHWKPLGPT